MADVTRAQLLNRAKADWERLSPHEQRTISREFWMLKRIRQLLRANGQAQPLTAREYLEVLFPMRESGDH